MKRMQALTLLLLAVALPDPSAGGQPAMPNALPSMPDGYHLQAYDDCGAPERQPHIAQTTAHTFSTAEVDADPRVRSVAWGWKAVDAAYDHLDPSLDYVLAVTYANEAFNNRVQSLWAGSTQIHGPHALPKGGWERLLFRVPREATRDGRLALQFRLEAQVNVVVSVVELWAPAPSPEVLRICDVAGLTTDLEGKVLDLACMPVAGAEVRLRRPGAAETLAAAQTDQAGAFRFARGVVDGLAPRGDLEVEAASRALSAVRAVPASELYFAPVHYRPIPTKVYGRGAHLLSLDGAWRIRTDSPEQARGAALDAAGWGAFHVPGQWLQQGYDVPQDRPVALAREFTVPRAWAERRVFLRFDAIHAGTRYWVNGKYLGRSENLFTPVEWEVTDALRFGQSNRLDLEMVVDTPSERLSYASGYAFHSLGGIDRSVRLFALPETHISELHIATDLDADYRDADLKVRAGLDGGQGATLRIELAGPDGRVAARAAREVAGSEAEVLTHVADPAKWSAEKPNLYRLVLEVVRGDRVLERVERQVGFRKIEVRDSQLYVNGRRVKLAGACHHEIDPLTGRADTMRHAEQDVKLLKAANLNYIRTSHYPPCQELLDAADRIGMYVEVEAPFCWVGEVEDMRDLRAVLTPTSAMVDYHHSHPSVIVWSLANESAFNRLFEVSSRLVKELDPTRPTTFNNPDPKRLCDIANLHYAPMPYDEQLKGDPRPLFWGEYFFPVCHEQTDVRVDPGLRELWGHGHADPDSAWGRLCATGYDPRYMRPGALPGTWSYIVRSERVVGGAIWAALDEPFYFANGKKVGYAWVHGFWGVIDAWRRPKPEWWLSKMIFSPVWFPVRRVDLAPGETDVTVPVENRYAFTDLSELTFAWQAGRRKGTVKVEAPPAATGRLTLPVPAAARPGDTITVRALDSRGEVVSVLPLQLGERPTASLPVPRAGAPRWHDDGKTVTVEGEGFRLAVDRATGRGTGDGGAPLLGLPEPHVTQYDFGDLDGPYRRPYAVLPDSAGRVVESLAAAERPGAVELTVHDHYEAFAGSVQWVIDRKGVGRVAYDYVYSGPDMSAREVGLRFLLPAACDTLRWKRWSEWGVFPADSISRTAGTARARRDPKWGDGPERTRPKWPWSLDQTEQGTADFRSTKYCVYEASLAAPDGRGLRVRANADAHVRACLDPAGVRLHVLSRCGMGPVILKTGDHIAGEVVVDLAGAKPR